MLMSDIVTRVQSKCDDPDGTYITSDYVIGFSNDVLDWIFNQFALTGSQFDTNIIVLPSVTAGLPNLDQYQAAGQPLALMVLPRMVRWKLPGTDATYWRRADGPMDYIHDIQNGIPQLDSWAWQRWSLKLSNY